MFKKYLMALLVCISPAVLHAAPVKIVAAENFYGELAKEIGGDQVSVDSIINNPDADPHLFSTSPAVSKKIAEAQIIIYNGAGYDAWMDQIIANLDPQRVVIINVADLMGVAKGANPHLWYDPETFPKLANVLAAKLNKFDPQSTSLTEERLNKFMVSYAHLAKQIQAIKDRYQGTAVTATEPVFGYMANALGLNMLGEDFQWKIMNDSEPSPKMIAEYQRLLTEHKVNIVFYNSQVTDPLTDNLRALATQNKIAVIGVSETMPRHEPVMQWLTQEVSSVQAALEKSHP
jgi:zinc/manganese transport system substrate-binding protein